MQGDESQARSEGLQRIRSDIDAIQEQVLSLRADVEAGGKVKDGEMQILTTELHRMVPLAVQQVAQAQAALFSSNARHWEALAKRLGGRVD